VAGQEDEECCAISERFKGRVGGRFSDSRLELIIGDLHLRFASFRFEKGLHGFLRKCPGETWLDEFETYLLPAGKTITNSAVSLNSFGVHCS
jgi:hypothetical protein